VQILGVRFLLTELFKPLVMFALYYSVIEAVRNEHDREKRPGLVS